MVYQNSGTGTGFSLRGRKTREGLPGLQNIDLSVAPGQTLGILGKSGAGKSTLGKVICGLQKPSSGSIKIHDQLIVEDGLAIGENRSAKSKKTRAGIAQMIWQDAQESMNPRLQVAEIIAEPLIIGKDLEKDQIMSKVIELMTEVALPTALIRRYPHELSGGEAQRVIIARALAVDPALLVCDEPASALDISAKVQIADLLQRLRKERGTAIILIAHDLGMIRKLTNWLLVLDDGKVVEAGPTRQLLNMPAQTCLQEILDAEPVFTGTNTMKNY